MRRRGLRHETARLPVLRLLGTIRLLLAAVWLLRVLSLSVLLLLAVRLLRKVPWVGPILLLI